MKLSKSIIQTAVLALTMAVYSMYGQELWLNWLKSSGVAIGFGEIALGYAIAITFSMILTWFLTRGMDKHE